MSWLSRLLGGGTERPQAVPPGPARIRIPAHGRLVVSIPELDFVGERTASPNGRYTLLWHDRRWIDGNVSDGRYVLIDGDAVIVDGRMERPQDGKVADNGSFILNDWGAADELSGTFHALGTDGEPILARTYSANLLNNGLSADGRLAVCQTANAPVSSDSSALSVFDLVAGGEIATWTAESGWASAYEFPEGGDRIRMVRRDRPSLDYSLAGDFLDRALWLRDEVGRGTLYVIRKALAEGAGSGLTADELRAGVHAWLSGDDRRFDADAWRLLGEIEEAAGEPAAALAAYEKALGLNPKIGVAKRAAALRKELAS